MRCLFLVFLMVSVVPYCGAQPKADGSTSNQAVSYPNPRSDLQAVFYPKPNDKLKTYFHNYVDFMAVEFALCLYGRVRNDRLIVKRVEFPFQRQRQLIMNVRYNQCSNGVVAVAHAHPNTILNTKYTFFDYRNLFKCNDSMGVKAGVLLYRPHGSGPIHAKVFDPEKIREAQR